MSNAIATRLGAVNGAAGNYSEANQLFLKIFAGEVMSAFQSKNIMMDRHLVRTITSGKSAQFPVTGKISSQYHKPGDEILGSGTPKNNEVTINIDDMLIAHAFIPNIDEAKNHYDIRSIYTHESGNALSRAFDKNAMQVGVLAARAVANLTGAENLSASGSAMGGSQIEMVFQSGTNSDKEMTSTLFAKATVTERAEAIASSIFEAAKTLDEKDVPNEDRVCILRPQEYYTLIQNTDVINQNWGGSGSYSDGKVWRIAGMEIVNSNHMPNSVINTTDGQNNTYNGDFSKTMGLVMNKYAIGTVKLMDLVVEAQYDIRRQGSLIVAKYALGTSILRPECAVEIKLGDG